MDEAPSPGRLTPDRLQIERLNSLWQIIDAPVGGGGARARLAAVARRLLGRVLARQQEFNASLVDHINRNMPVLEEFGRVAAELQSLRDIERQALLARERRSDAAVSALMASHEELRAAVGVLQQATQNLKRELARAPQAVVATPAPGAASAAGGTSAPAAVPAHAPAMPSNQFEALDSHKYVGFEDHFRGSEADIRARLEGYLPVFAGAADVLDIGCGRGEFLALLREQGVTARGIDLNPAMVEVCRERGLAAEAVDALAYLRGLPDGSLGGLFAAQVIEHLEPNYLGQLLDVAWDKLRPGSAIVLETINPACWFAFFESYVRDITHVRPIHPDTIRFLLVASGFQQVEIAYKAPYPEHEKLQPVGGLSGVPSAGDWADVINANVEKINRLLFTWLDYAAIGRRP